MEEQPPKRAAASVVRRACLLVLDAVWLLFRGVVLISAVLEHRPIREGAAKGAWRGLPVLLIHGADDRRIPLGFTRDRLAEIQEGGAQADTMTAEGEDHFLLFSQRDAVLARIASWLEAQAGTRQAGPY